MRIYTPFILVCIFLLNIASTSIAQDSKQELELNYFLSQEAERIFQVQDPEWEVYSQNFFNEHILFILDYSSDERMYMRPIISFDKGNNGVIVTQGVEKVSSEKILKRYNTIVKNETIRIDSDNVNDYALFFAEVYGLAQWMAYEYEQLFLPKDKESKDEVIIRQWLNEIEERGVGLDIKEEKGYYLVTYKFLEGSHLESYDVKQNVKISTSGEIKLLKRINKKIN